MCLSKRTYVLLGGSILLPVVLAASTKLKRPNPVTVPGETAIHVTLNHALASDQNKPGDHSEATVQQVQEGSSPISTFTGTVWMNGGKFVLRDASHKVWYQLDDQRLAARFEGKQVRVTGTLDTENNSIQVLDIREDPVHGASFAVPANPLLASSLHQQIGSRLLTR